MLVSGLNGLYSNIYKRISGYLLMSLPDPMTGPLRHGRISPGGTPPTESDTRYSALLTPDVSLNVTASTIQKPIYNGTLALSTATEGQAYTFSIVNLFNTGGTPTSYAMETGSVGTSTLTFNTTTGVLSGTPANDTDLTGLSFSATNAGGTSATSNTDTLTINATGTGDSGGTADFSWNAPTGLSDLNELVVATTGTAFNKPDKQIWLGFGRGWLYDNADGTEMVNTLLVEGETMTFEVHDPTRNIKTIGSQKYLYSLLVPDGTSQYNQGGGMLQWNIGYDLTNADTAFTFSRSRCSIGILPTAELQWKQERINEGPGAVDNYAFITESGGTGNGFWQRIDTVEGGGGGLAYSTTLPVHDGKFNSHMWSWHINTPDAHDGSMRVRHITENETGMELKTPANWEGFTGDGVITTGSSARI